MQLYLCERSHLFICYDLYMNFQLFILAFILHACPVIQGPRVGSNMGLNAKIRKLLVKISRLARFFIIGLNDSSSDNVS